MAFLTCLLSRLMEIYCSLKSKPRRVSSPSYKNTDYENLRNMDFEQRFTEGSDVMYTADEEFLENLREWPKVDAICIMRKLSQYIECLNYTDELADVVSSYINRRNRPPLFFEIEFLREHDYVLFISIREIDSDEYLDAINSNQILKECT